MMHAFVGLWSYFILYFNIFIQSLPTWISKMIQGKRAHQIQNSNPNQEQGISLLWMKRAWRRPVKVFLTHTRNVSQCVNRAGYWILIRMRDRRLKLHRSLPSQLRTHCISVEQTHKRERLKAGEDKILRGVWRGVRSQGCVCVCETVNCG